MWWATKGRTLDEGADGALPWIGPREVFASGEPRHSWTKGGRAARRTAFVASVSVSVSVVVLVWCVGCTAASATPGRCQGFRARMDGMVPVPDCAGCRMM